MGWLFYDTQGAVKRNTTTLATNATQLNGVEGSEYVTHANLDLALSGKSDQEHIHTDAVTMGVSQSSIVTDATGAWVDLPGCALTLPPGKWIVMANGTPRVWQSGTGYTKGLNQLRIVDSGVTTTYAFTQVSGVVQAEQAAPMACSLMFSFTLTSYLSIKAQGAHSIITGGANFAGGWRWDSGFGNPATLYAMKVGP